MSASECNPRSPIVARVNASLGQVAVANGEYATAVVEAFMAAHEGYSADRLLADPAINDRFLDNCRLLGIPGDAKNWNHLLLNVRKRGGLAAIDTSRRTAMKRSAMDPFIFASEIAWRTVSKELVLSLDEIFCNPESASRFDQLAARIAPGYSPFQYRWGAFSIRKDASQGNQLLDKVDGKLARRIHSLSTVARLTRGAGHYLITASGAPFFVGFAEQLPHCPFFNPDRLAAGLDVAGVGFRSEADIEIRTRTFDISIVQRNSEGEPADWKSARRAKLLEKFHPIGNISGSPKRNAPRSRSAA